MSFLGIFLETVPNPTLIPLTKNLYFSNYSFCPQLPQPSQINWRPMPLMITLTHPNSPLYLWVPASSPRRDDGVLFVSKYIQMEDAEYFGWFDWGHVGLIITSSDAYRVQITAASCLCAHTCSLGGFLSFRPITANRICGWMQLQRHKKRKSVVQQLNLSLVIQGFFFCKKKPLRLS